MCHENNDRGMFLTTSLVFRLFSYSTTLFLAYKEHGSMGKRDISWESLKTQIFFLVAVYIAKKYNKFVIRLWIKTFIRIAKTAHAKFSWTSYKSRLRAILIHKLCAGVQRSDCNNLWRDEILLNVFGFPINLIKMFEPFLPQRRRCKLLLLSASKLSFVSVVWSLFKAR